MAKYNADAQRPAPAGAPGLDSCTRRPRRHTGVAGQLGTTASTRSAPTPARKAVPGVCDGGFGGRVGRFRTLSALGFP